MNDFYQQLSTIPDTIISLQYSADEFLTFRPSQASGGQIVYVGTKAVGLQCQINGRSYTLDGEHFRQMSDRECRELFSHLGIDGSQLL